MLFQRALNRKVGYKTEEKYMNLKRYKVQSLILHVMYKEI
uniref:Uncharacterized protein n=1 Tax=Rhizophora mucronata TaxID=61149 RepID=A0A2P2P3I5_RHIMU